MRSTFGRLYKKVLQTQPKSGASGDQMIYTPTWPLYYELLFLKDAIRPRRTTSNFSNVAHASVKEITEHKQLNKPTSMSAFKTSQNPMKDTFQKVSSCTSALLQQNVSEESVDNLASPIDCNFLESLSNSDSSQNSQTDIGSVTFLSSKAMELPPRKKIKVETPPPDCFYNKRKLKDEEDMKIFKDMADSMRSLTATFSSNISKQGTSQDSYSGLVETVNPEIEAFLQILKGALRKIPSTSQIPC